MHKKRKQSSYSIYVEPVAGKLRLAATDIQNENMSYGLTKGILRGGMVLSTERIGPLTIN